MDFSNKTALTTGSGQGVGEGIARALASYGANVCLVGRTFTKVEAVAEDINQQGGSAIAIECDVKNNESINAYCVKHHIIENIQKKKYSTHNGLQETKYKVNIIDNEDNSK